MSRGTILVVEDNEMWREQIFKKKLEAEGYEVLTAEGYEAMKEYLYPGAFDVAVVDIGLSPKDYQNVDGMKVLDEIAALDSNIPAIVVSGRGAEGVNIHAPEFHRTIAFLEKESFDRNEFLRVVDKAMRVRTGQTQTL